MNFFDWLSSQFGTYERPSPSDIVPEDSISVVGSRVMIDCSHLNVPFTHPPRLYPTIMIPDTNSMDGIFDYGNNILYIEPADEENHHLMVEFVAREWKDKGNANDCVYRMMQNTQDDPKDFSKPYLFYAIHRIFKVSSDSQGRYFIFKGINNPCADPYRARDKNILWLSGGIIY